MISGNSFDRSGGNGEEGIGYAGDDQTNRLRPSAFEAARGDIWLIPEFFDRFLDPGHRSLAHILASIDHARNGTCTYSGAPRHVDQYTLSLHDALPIYRKSVV